jgi:DNA-binding transcriptional ArsR family regulator
VPESYEVTDPAALRAVAHPLRLRLLGHLRATGPATASGLGRAVGESSGSTSYHLRQLERYGFIEPDPEQPSRREKVWRAVHRSTSLRMWDGAGPAEQAALDTVTGVQIENLVRGVRRRQVDGSARWRDAHASSDYLLRITPESMAALTERVTALVAEFETPDDPDAELAVLHVQSYLYESR